jgi:hypothetical protein
MMSGIISKPVEMIYTVGYQATPKIKLEAVHRQVQQLDQLVASRKMSKNITMSFTVSTGQVPGYPYIYQNLALVGFSYALY